MSAAGIAQLVAHEAAKSNLGALKMQDWKIQDWILVDQIAGLEKMQEWKIDWKVTNLG